MDEAKQEKKLYEAPAFRVVRLEVNTSVLSSCRASTGGVSPDINGCHDINKCYI
jgi:hypothetical protein